MLTVSRRRPQTLAWVLGLGGAVACLVTVALTVALRLYSDLVLVYLTIRVELVR